MIKIFNPSISKQILGGGHSFRRNIEKALQGQVEWVNSWQECDVYLISSVTIVDKSEIYEAKRAGKKIILRVDNMPRKSRNLRMSPHERMREFASMSDWIIYQSKWAKEWIGSYIGFMEKSSVILNGVDTEIFKPMRIAYPLDYKIFMYIQYNRDENKRMTEAFDMFTEEWLKNPKHILWLVGQFSPEIIAAGFDFFRGEQFIYHGIITMPEGMASLMQKADVLLYPSYSDACPNTCVEAKACGMEVWHKGYAGVGEACNLNDNSLDYMGKQYLQIFNQITGEKNVNQNK